MFLPKTIKASLTYRFLFSGCWLCWCIIFYNIKTITDLKWKPILAAMVVITLLSIDKIISRNSKLSEKFMFTTWEFLSKLHWVECQVREALMEVLANISYLIKLMWDFGCEIPFYLHRVHPLVRKNDIASDLINKIYIKKHNIKKEKSSIAPDMSNG